MSLTVTAIVGSVVPFRSGDALNAEIGAGIELAPLSQSSAQIIQFGVSSWLRGEGIAQLAVLGAISRWNRAYVILTMLFR